LTAVVEGAAALPKGKALDVGCGTGDTSIYLAKHGWNVTAIDFVQLAIDKARAKTAAAGVNVRYVRGDVTQLGSHPRVRPATPLSRG
jgi:2-polyprenyl-3-methyl-5-hydroxy-6-metoxy-1,4-benzoquinol methylase